MFAKHSLALLLIWSPVHVVSAAISFTDHFDTSHYGPTLDNGESANPSIYTWQVINHVNASTSIPIGNNGAEIAWHSQGHGHPRAAEADLVFTEASRPQLQGTILHYDLVERHDYTDLYVKVEGHANHQIFSFAQTGTVKLEFTDLGIDEYINNSFIQTRSYASLGWAADDTIVSFQFVGRHHDNSHLNISAFDNIQFSAVPEPSSSMMLAIGVFALGIRKRK
ncbi:PEP-CTERM sorting domain-containing protein [Verrucomicrobiaceae bacterium N1E253]|uniref:PEP-CTERM sorting domain-containing protein n=1 Tax=Oceaniferula marina TaxID=2748318 RepID=A0A851GMS0_9BACT|nr:PEP-CTERM sorting domain-containing protein [Oceaniferula marina]NWK55404.1 PEP-CTERM sorting domain-containing protein [Oceaniferula marina]